jgi:hypothetical protein
MTRENAFVELVTPDLREDPLRYVLNILAGFSHLLNAICGGEPRYSFSARVGDEAEAGAKWAIYAARLIDGFFRRADHCHDQARIEGLI